MREAYLTGGAPAFTRTRPLSPAEHLLLEQAQEPTNKARYTYHDCEKHGLFAVDNELGLAFVNCPRSKKCVVQEVFDPAGYAEHYIKPAPEPEPAPQLTPEQSQKVDELLALGRGQVDFPPAELRRRMENILGVKISADPEQLLEALNTALVCGEVNKSKRPEPDPEEEEEPDPDADLTEVELYASQMFSPREICTILGFDYEAQRDDPEFNKQVQRGALIQQSRMRSTIFLHARMGSAPAQTEALKLIQRAAVAAAGEHD